MPDTVAPHLLELIAKLRQMAPLRETLNDEERSNFSQAHGMLDIVSGVVDTISDREQLIMMTALHAGAITGRYVDRSAFGLMDFDVVETRAALNKKARSNSAQMSALKGELRIRLTMEHYKGPLTTGTSALSLLRETMTPIWQTKGIPAPGDTTLRKDVTEIKRRRVRAAD